MECSKVPPVRKVKKQPVKDELDRIKQAEKKKRRLEKALAASAAIRSELEKKKQKKKEEQQRLDEEGAAIAEAVALHVLLGEDTDDPCKIMLRKDAVFSHWDCASNIELFIGGRSAGLPHHQVHSKCSLEGFGWASNACGDVNDWNGLGNNSWSFSSGPFDRDIHASYFEEGSWGASAISTGLVAAQAVSSLHITEDAHRDSIVFNQMLRN